MDTTQSNAEVESADESPLAAQSERALAAGNDSPPADTDNNGDTGLGARLPSTGPRASPTHDVLRPKQTCDLWGHIERGGAQKRRAADPIECAAAERPTTAQRTDGLTASDHARLRLIASVPALHNHRDARGRRHGIAIDLSRHVTDLIAGELSELIGSSQVDPSQV
eukprot:CAMPEP_0183359884 /NCGR_PEP_ID=MMETSP0164_2-20130417/53634_1 /TAXON_ID=221442 /ORGANISM="Coccolithus pelagicus ssp braarudi, Strain PLY182g" /LENGTH=166 /DNA_ID=CAMNT_0025534105 /DNA_START=14 /DNA_END=514 /DNA_ORIENTATION=+